MSDKPVSVFEAIRLVMTDVQAVGKSGRNTEQGYNFRGIDAVINAVGPAFRKHGIVATPVKSQASYRDVLTSREKRSRECTVSVTYRFYGPAGDYIDAEVPGESMDFGDKGAPKAMSVAYRIALLQVLCIPTDEPEPDSHSYERSDGGTKAIQLFAAVMDAKSEAALRKAWEAIRDTFDEGGITEREAEQLNAHVKRRQPEVSASGDSADESKSVTPPQYDPTEQAVIYDAWVAELAKAADMDAIAAIGKLIKAGKSAGEISPVTVDRLAQAAAARKAEINGVAS